MQHFSDSKQRKVAAIRENRRVLTGTFRFFVKQETKGDWVYDNEKSDFYLTQKEPMAKEAFYSVSYTHLTLPTICSV